MARKNGVPKWRTLLGLFLSMLKISAFTFGGGFVIVTLMKRRFVDELGWLDGDEMLDLTALAQSAPGAIAVNASILVGWKVMGGWGVAVSVLGTVIPPLVVLSLVSLFYKAFAANRYVAILMRGMRAGVAAVVWDVVFSLGGGLLKKRKAIYPVLMVSAFVLTFFLKVNVVFAIIGAALLGALLGWAGKKGGKLGNLL